MKIQHSLIHSSIYPFHIVLAFWRIFVAVWYVPHFFFFSFSYLLFDFSEREGVRECITLKITKTNSESYNDIKTYVYTNCKKRKLCRINTYIYTAENIDKKQKKNNKKKILSFSFAGRGKTA